MKKSLFIIFLFPLIAFSQKKQYPPRGIYDNLSGVQIINSITWEHLKGGFSFGDVHISYTTQIDSNNTFQLVEGDCLAGGTVLKHGTWKIKDGSTLILRSKKRSVYHDIVKFGHFLFCVNAKERLRFVEDFQKERNEVSHYKIDSTETRYTKDFLVALNLLKKYPGTELMH